MIPDLQACLLCDDVRQERNGKFILIGLFDVINANQYPLVFPRMCLVTRWCNGEGEYRQLSRLLKPDQKTIMAQGQTIPVRLPGMEAVVTNIEFFINIAFTESGIHWIEVLLDNDLKIRFPLRVVRIPAPPAKPAGPSQE
ncbi:MAG: hypothetical protein Q7J98_09280 [Kiritimatiellia bacterium]|nr:hypothetical protein [Kiritimatiellia bacterium]